MRTGKKTNPLLRYVRLVRNHPRNGWFLTSLTTKHIAYVRRSMVDMLYEHGLCVSHFVRFKWNWKGYNITLSLTDEQKAVEDFSQKL